MKQLCMYVHVCMCILMVNSLQVCTSNVCISDGLISYVLYMLTAMRRDPQWKDPQ